MHLNSSVKETDVILSQILPRQQRCHRYSDTMPKYVPHKLTCCRQPTGVTRTPQVQTDIGWGTSVHCYVLHLEIVEHPKQKTYTGK